MPASLCVIKSCSEIQLTPGTSTSIPSTLPVLSLCRPTISILEVGVVSHDCNGCPHPISEWQIEFWLLPFKFTLLRKCLLTKQLRHWRSCRLCGTHAWGSWLLASFWPSPGCCEYQGSGPADSSSFFLSFCLSNQ